MDVVWQEMVARQSLAHCLWSRTSSSSQDCPVRPFPGLLDQVCPEVLREEGQRRLWFWSCLQMLVDAKKEATIDPSQVSYDCKRNPNMYAWLCHCQQGTVPGAVQTEGEPVGRMRKRCGQLSSNKELKSSDSSSSLLLTATATLMKASPHVLQNAELVLYNFHGSIKVSLSVKKIDVRIVNSRESGLKVGSCEFLLAYRY